MAPPHEPQEKQERGKPGEEETGAKTPGIQAGRLQTRRISGSPGGRLNAPAHPAPPSHHRVFPGAPTLWWAAARRRRQTRVSIWKPDGVFVFICKTTSSHAGRAGGNATTHLGSSGKTVPHRMSAGRLPYGWAGKARPPGSSAKKKKKNARMFALGLIEEAAAKASAHSQDFLAVFCVHKISSPNG